MSNIDERIVEIKFDNGQFEKGVLTTLKSLETLEKGMDIKASGKGLEELSKLGQTDLSGLAKSVELVSSKFSTMGIIGVTALQNITNSALNTSKALLKSLTTDQITAGFSKYEQKTAAVQTIMSATGKTVDEVNGSLEKLIWFTDETSYNFVDMVSNIGKFTAVGQELDASVTAMQGIANWAALSGQGANEASRAMYNLAQAIGVGSVRLIDWKSIENANMGTKEFKETVIETAKAVGTLNKAGKTKTGKLVTFQNFSETLKDEWFSSEVLMGALDKYGAYADEVFRVASEQGITAAEAMNLVGTETMDLGARAFKAAQQAKTFTEVLNATKDAASSGWMKSFELVFGNYDEAVSLWSDLAQDMYELFAESGEARNELIEGWKDSGGRDDMIAGLYGIVQAIKNIKLMAADTFHKIFPSTTVKTLTDMTKSFREFGEYLDKVTSYVEVGTGVFDALESSISKVDTGLNELFSGTNLRRGAKNTESDVKQLQERLQSLGYDLGKTGVDGIIGPKTEAAIKKFQKDKNLIIDGIYGKETHASLMEVLGLSGGEETKITETERKARIFGTTMQKLQNIFGGAMAVVGIGVKVFGFLGNVLKALGKTVKPIGDAFLTIGSAIGSALMGFNEWLGTSGFFEDRLEDVTKILQPFTTWIQNGTSALMKFFGLDGGEKLEGQLSPFMTRWNEITRAFEKNETVKKVKGAFTRIKDEFVKIGPIFKGYVDTAKKYLGEKFGDIWEKGMNALPNVLEAVGNGIVWFVDRITPYVQKIPGLIQKIKTFFIGLWETTGDDGTKVPGVLQNAMTWFKDVYDQLKESENLSAFVDNVRKIFEGLRQTIVDFFSTFNQSSDDSDTGEIEDNMSAIQKIGKTLSDVWKGFMDFLSDAYEGAKILLETVGPEGILGIIAGIIGFTTVIGTVKAIKKLVKSLTDISKIFKKRLKGGDEQGVGFAKSLLTIAASIAIIVGAIYFLGKMDPSVLKQGAITLGAIIAVLVGMSILAGRLKGDTAKNISSVGKAVQSLAVGLAVITAAIYVLGGMDSGRLVKGGVAIIAIMTLLIVFSKLAGKMEVSANLKGLIGLSIAIGIMALMINLIGKMKPERFIGGFIGLTSIMALLVVFAKVLNTANGVNVKLKGLIGLSIAIGVLVAIIHIIGGMDPERFIGGFLGLVALMTALVIFAKSVSKLSGSKVNPAGLLSMALVLGALTLCVSIIGNMPTKNAIQGIIGVVAIMAAFAILSKAISGINIKSAVGALLLLVGLAGLIWVFGETLKGIEDIQTDKLIAFAAGISGVLLAFGIFTAIAGSVSFAGVGAALLAIIGLIGIVAGVIAALSWLGGQEWFGPSMDNASAAMEKLGEMVGSFTGAMKGADAKAFAKSMTAFDDFEVDEEGINNAIAGAQLLADFANGLPDKDIGTRIADFIMGSKMQDLSEDMLSFAKGFSGFSLALDRLSISEDLITKTTEALEVAQLVSDFSTKLPAVPLMTRITGWSAPMEKLVTDMNVLAPGFANFSKAMDSFVLGEGLSDKVTDMISVATSVSDFSSTLPEVPLLDKIFGWKTPMESLASDMSTLTEGFNGFSSAMSDIEVEEDLSDKTASIITIAKAISDFSKGLKDPPIMTQLAGWKTPMEQLTTDMGTLIGGFYHYNRSLSNITLSEGSAEKTTAIIAIAKSVDEFSKGLKDPPLMTNFLGWVTPMENLTANMATLISGFVAYDYALGLFALSEDTADKTTDIITIAQSIATFSEGLKDPPVMTQLAGWSTPMETLASDMTTLVSGISKWGKAVADISDTTIATDTDTALTASQSIADFLSGLSDLKLDDRSGFDQFFNKGATSGDTLFGLINKFGAAIKDASISLSGLSESTLTTDVAAAKLALTSITEFLAWLSSGDVKINASAWGIWGTYTSEFDTIMSQMGTIADKISEFSGKTINVDATKFQTIMSAIKTFTNSLSAISKNPPTDSVALLKTALDELTTIFNGEGDSAIDPDAFMAGLNADAIAAKVTEAANIVTSAVSDAASGMSQATSGFNSTGAEIGSAIATGVSGNSDAATGAVSTLISNAKSSAILVAGQFSDVGKAMDTGIAKGLKDNAHLASLASAAVARQCLAAARAAIDSHSPSRAFAKLGRDANEGTAMGFWDNAKLVADASAGVSKGALTSARSALANFSTILASDMEVDPVIRPVVDLSDVRAGAKQISTLMSNQGSVSITGTQTRNLARSISVSSPSDKIQNGSPSPTTEATLPTEQTPLISGNVFNVRNENDIVLLASELATLTRSGQRNLGAPVGK